MVGCSRRNFLRAGLAAGVVAGSGPLPARTAQRSATDWVTLGKSGVNVTRLAFGTGTNGGQVQRSLGQDAFTKLVRHAYDGGIRFFETSETYAGMHQMLGEALSGIPRDTYRLMTKVTTRADVNPRDKIDELRKLAKTEYFDVMLMHWQHLTSWPEDTVRWQDGILQAQSSKVVLAHGASVHGLPALRRMPDNRWLEIAMICMNHAGAGTSGRRDEVVAHVKAAHRRGLGVISVKLAGDGTFTKREDRQAAMCFAFNNAGVDCVTVGYKSPAEIDEAIENLNLALA